MPVLEPYSAYKPSGIQWLGDVPTYWELVPSRAVFTEINERDHPDEQMLSVTIARGVIRQKILLQDSSQKDSSRLDKSAYKLVCPGDLAYNKMRAWQGAFGVSTYRGIVSPAYVVQRPRNGANALYFHHLLRTPAFAAEAERWSYGIASDMWSLRPEHFKMMYVPLPPLPEQAAIVRYLNYVDRRIRWYVAAKRKLIALLEEEQAIINQAVTRGLDTNVRLKPSGVEWLGDVPEHWEIARFSRQISIAEGQVDPTVEPYASMPLIAPNHLEARTGRLLNQETASEQGAISSKYLCRAGDVIYSKIRPALAKVVVAPTDCLCSADMYPLSPRHSLQANYLFWLLLSKAFTAWSVLESDRVAMPKINRSTLNSYHLPIPPVSEQAAIVRHLDEAVTNICTATDSARRQIELVQEYRTRLIADVVTGKLDVREAAAQLLDEADDQDLIGESGTLADGLPGDLYDIDESVEDSAMEEEVTI